MGEAWSQTVVAIITEFGRTARINGNDGTDHGTATVALLAGGALKGGRVIADWPGLKEVGPSTRSAISSRQTDLRAVLKGILKDHLRADEAKLASDIFPGSATVKPLSGLVTSARLFGVSMWGGVVGCVGLGGGLGDWGSVGRMLGGKSVGGRGGEFDGWCGIGQSVEFLGGLGGRSGGSRGMDNGWM